MAAIKDINLDFLPDNPDGIYLVGGTVRDLLAGHHPADIDLVVKGDITALAAQIAVKTGGRSIDLGKKGFNVLRVASPGLVIDITPLSHASIEADLRQRDFTINAMAYDVGARRLVDCTGGLTDMRRKKIRLVSPTAFARDPARLVRAYRMAAVFNFSLSAETRNAVNACRHLVGSVAGERIWAELIRIFNTADSAPVIKEMAASGLLTAIFPELQSTIGCMQNHHHQFDVFDHSLRTYERLEDLLAGHRSDLMTIAEHTGLAGHAAILKYSALLHDVGKPISRRVDEKGCLRFPGHAAMGARIAGTISRRLKLAGHQRTFADIVIRHHIRPLHLFIACQNRTLGPQGMVRFFNRCGRLTLPIIVHAMADNMAKRQEQQSTGGHFITFCHHLANAYRDYKSRQAAIPPLINGRDLISIFGLSPSPRFKQILSRVDEHRLSGALTTRDQAIKWVSAYLAKEPASKD